MTTGWAGTLGLRGDSGMNKRATAVLAVVAVTVAIVACTKPPVVPPVLPTTTVDPNFKQPNVVRIMTDDQDVSSLQYMAKTQELLAAKGVSFTNSTVTLSLCCPSRVTALTGQYTHNHNVWDNGGKTGGYPRFANQANTLAPWLKAAGYTTAHVGKYMNGYGKSVANQVPPGWDNWFNIVDEPYESYPYWGYTISDNGVQHTYGTADEDYATDVFANRAVTNLQAMEATGKPFFLDYWPTAPHYGRGRDSTVHLGPPPAPRHAQGHTGLEAARSSNFLPSSSPIPPTLWTMGGLFRAANGGQAAYPQILDDAYRDYVNSLQAVDESIERLVNELQASGELANTLIIFTSDNGLMWGNHGLVNFKWEPYEESLRVPLIMTGPGIPQGVTTDRPVSNIDVVPTILQATRAQAGRLVDGTSLLPLPRDPAAGQDRVVLVESNMYDPASMYQFNGYKVPRFKAVRTGTFQYTEWMDGYVELYDLQLDPQEMQNRADDPQYAADRAQLSAALGQLQSCAGSACNLAITGLTHPGGPSAPTTSTSTATTSTTAPDETTTTTGPGETTTTTEPDSTTTTAPVEETTTTSPAATGSAGPPRIDLPGLPPDGGEMWGR